MRRSRIARLLRKSDLARDTEIAWLAVEEALGEIAWSPSGNGTARTWDDVRTIIRHSATPQSIILKDVDPSSTVYYDVPAGVTDLKGSVFDCAPGSALQAILRLADGAQLRNGGFRQVISGMFNGGMGVEFHSTPGSPYPLAWDTSTSPAHFAAFGFGGGANIQNLGSLPALHVPPAAPDSLLIVVMANTARILPGTAPIVELDSGAFTVISVFQNGAGSIDPGWITGDATNLLAFLSEGFDFGQVPSWAGIAASTVINNPDGMIGGSGPTAYRPFGALVPLIKGTDYWDTDLVPPRIIYWDGAQFVDALGIGPV